jgi:exodeoxyribonuclease VII small subunit
VLIINDLRNLPAILSFFFRKKIVPLHSILSIITTMNKPKQMTYRQAVEEIELTLAQMENDETDVDMLAEKVKRVLELLAFCNARLRRTEEEIAQLQQADQQNIT